MKPYRFKEAGALRRRMWVHLPPLWESGGFEKALNNLVDMGVEEALPLISGVKEPTSQAM